MLTNAGLVVTAADRAGEADPMLQAIAEAKREQASRDDLSRDAANVSEVGAKLIVAPERFKDKGGFSASSRPHISPQYRKDARGILREKIYTPNEFGAALDGRFCPRCDEYQGDDVPPGWVLEATDDFRCAPPGGHGCSWPQGHFGMRMLREQLGLRILVLTNDKRDAA